MRTAIPEPVVVDARAKIVWGEPHEKVLLYLRGKGVGEQDAASLLEELLIERDATIRQDGRRSIAIGVLFLLAPFVYYLVRVLVGFWSLKVFSALIVLAIVGFAKIVKGTQMVARPRSVRGDLSNGAL